MINDKQQQSNDLNLISGCYTLMLLAAVVGVLSLFLPWLRLKGLFVEVLLDGWGSLNWPLGQIAINSQDATSVLYLAVASAIFSLIGLATHWQIALVGVLFSSSLETGLVFYKLNNLPSLVNINLPFGVNAGISFQPEVGLWIYLASAILGVLLSGLLLLWHKTG